MKRKTRKVTHDFTDAIPKTVQSDRTKTDIQRIKQSGFEPVDPNQMTFADVSGEFDYRDALDKIVEIEESFAMLPAVVRAQFKNDPIEAIEFVQNSENLEKAAEMGLIPKPEISQPVENQPVEKKISEISQTVEDQPVKKKTPSSSTSSS